MVAAWGEGYFPFLYQNHPDPNYDPVSNGIMAWDLYREMWGSSREFVIDGNMTSVEYTDRLSSIKIPTLITVGDHDECDPSLSQEIREDRRISPRHTSQERTYDIRGSTDSFPFGSGSNSSILSNKRLHAIKYA